MKSRSFSFFLQACAAFLASWVAGSAADAPDAFETLSDNLATARCRVADLQLESSNRFATDGEKKAAEEALPEARRTLERYRLEYGAVIQARPAYLKSRGEEAYDDTVYPAKAYEALLTLRNALLLSGTVDAAASKKGTLSSQDLIARLSEAAQGNGNEAFARTQKLYEELQPKLKAPGEETAALVKNLLGVIPSFLHATGDQEWVEDVVSIALSVDPTSASLWGQRALVRVMKGDAAGSLSDVIISKVLDGNDATGDAAYRKVTSLPNYLDSVYLEPYNDVDLTGGLQASLFGRDCHPNEERGTCAARRNLGRLLYAASFVNRREIRNEAVKSYVVEYKAALQATPNAMAAARTEFQALMDQAGDNGRKFLQAFDRVAPLLATEASFWGARARLFLTLEHPEEAEACIDIGETLASDEPWIASSRKEVDELRAKQPAS